MLPRATNFTIPAPKKPEPLPCPYDLNPMLSPSLSSKYPQFMSQSLLCTNECYWKRKSSVLLATIARQEDRDGTEQALTIWKVFTP